MIAVILMTVWGRTGFNMVIYLAGLQGISPELYEAAELEGASAWQRFRSITLPLLGPSTFFLLIMNVIYSFQVFDLVFVLTGGGPGNATTMLTTYAYANAFTTRAQGLRRRDRDGAARADARRSPRRSGGSTADGT